MNELLKISRVIAAPPQPVFDAWLDPATLTKFMCPMAGSTVDHAESDNQVGGRFRIVMRVGDTTVPIEGEYTAIDPHQRLMFTWLSDTAGKASTVELGFESHKEGTLVTLLHRGLPSANARAAHTAGWTSILNTLNDTIISQKGDHNGN